MPNIEKPASKVNFFRRFPKITDVAASFLQHGDESLHVILRNAVKHLVHRVDGHLFGGVLERHAFLGHHDIVYTAVILGHRTGDETLFLQIINELRHRVFVLLDDEGDGLLGERALVPKCVHDEVLLRRQVDMVLLKHLGKVFLKLAIQNVDINTGLFYKYHIIPIL